MNDSARHLHLEERSCHQQLLDRDRREVEMIVGDGGECSDCDEPLCDQLHRHRLRLSSLLLAALGVCYIDMAGVEVVTKSPAEIIEAWKAGTIDGGACWGNCMATLLNELERTGGKYGLQVMCEGGGMANATIIERLD